MAPLSDDAVECLATHAKALRFGDGPEGLALGNGCSVVIDRRPAALRHLAIEGTVILNPCDDVDHARGSILHETARQILVDHGFAEHPGDVERLALALHDSAVPVPSARRAV